MVALLGPAASLLAKIGLQLAGSLLTEKFLTWMFFHAAEKLVNSTETKEDDVVYEAIKKAYEAKNGK